jgi:hypothetical protein
MGLMCEHNRFKKNGYSKGMRRRFTCLDCGRNWFVGQPVPKENREQPPRGETVVHKRIYQCWIDMKKRCYYTHCNNYQNYGARGISICEEWLSDWKVFRDWALVNGYDEHLTIERKNVSGNYEPSNCCWITKAEQQKNKRPNRAFNGKRFKEPSAFIWWSSTYQRWRVVGRVEGKRMHILYTTSRDEAELAQQKFLHAIHH